MAGEKTMKNQNIKISEKDNNVNNYMMNKNNVPFQDEKNKSIFSNLLTQSAGDELKSEIISEGLRNKEECEQLIFKYYMRSEDLENKCTILHRNLQEVKDAWDRSKKLRDDALKERDNMIIKYATSEKKLLDERKMKETYQKKFEELTKEHDTLQHKLQGMIEEKARICLMYDDKIYEQKTLQSENNQIKNDNCILEKKLKLCQKSLKQQAELYNKSQTLIENLRVKYSEKLERDTKATEKSKNTYEESRKNEGYLFSEKVSEQQSLLAIVVESEKNDIEKHDQTHLSPLEFDLKYKKILQEKSELLKMVKQLESEKLELSNGLKMWGDPHLQNASDSQINSPQLDPRNIALINQTEQLKILNAHFNLLKDKNADLEIDIEAHKYRESQALLFTQHLTAKAMTLQSTYNTLEKKVEQLRKEQSSLKKNNVEYQSQCDTLVMQLREERMNHFKEKKKYLEEISLLKTELSTLNIQNRQLKQRIYDWEEEISIIKRKHKFSLREMQKQLGAKNTELLRNVNTEQSSSPLQKCSQTNNRACSNDQVKRINARKSDRLDFLEDQVNTLMSELQKKSKLLQTYMLRGRTDALTSNMMDDSKNELINGVMASIHGANVADKHLTLDLLLQINRKLQAVLEDALLENIILKENIDTMGLEIEKLRRQLKS